MKPIPEPRFMASPSSKDFKYPGGGESQIKTILRNTNILYLNRVINNKKVLDRDFVGFSSGFFGSMRGSSYE